jgi:hypothetical protein
MRCPNVQRCEVCDKLLIHKGSRSRYESSSYFGQIVKNICPDSFTWIDIDGAVWRRSIRLLRFIEHKSPGQRLDPNSGQRELLELLADVIEHLKSCPTAQQQFALHPKSGVFLIEGDPHEGNQLGDSKVTNLYRGYEGAPWAPASEEDALCWVALLDGPDRLYVRSKLQRRRRKPTA